MWNYLVAAINYLHVRRIKPYLARRKYCWLYGYSLRVGTNACRCPLRYALNMQNRTREGGTNAIYCDPVLILCVVWLYACSVECKWQEIY
jgi:hypothetical protein